MRRLNLSLIWLPWALLAAAILGFYLPWLWHPAAGLSPGGYDLAEWASLHPVARQMTPTMLPSFWIRAVMGILSALVAVQARQLQGKRIRWTARIIALVLLSTLFPPVEFFTNTGDANYQQQFALGMVSLALFVTTFWAGKWSRRGYDLATIVLGLLGIGFTVLGLFQGFHLMSSLHIEYVIGSGAILSASALAFLILSRIYKIGTLREQQKSG